MQIVTDSGTDIGLTPREMKELNIHIMPLVVTLNGRSYREGLDIETDAFYEKLDASINMPVTSPPTKRDFADLYRTLAKTDRQILSVHMTIGLSLTLKSARQGALMVPDARVTHVDTKTLSAAAGWQVKAAARAVKAGWSTDQVVKMIKQIGDASESIYTLRDLKYLINGGRISHMKGLIANRFNIKPMLGIEKVNGTLVQLGSKRKFNRALEGLVDKIKGFHEPGSKLYVQLLHASNQEDSTTLGDMIDKTFDCTWLPMKPMSLVLGAHTGRSMVGVAFAPMEVMSDIPV